MDYSLQVHEARYIFPIPDGLKELSSDIIREVLRHQPEHINGFVADYLETMLVVRENARDAGVVVCDVFREGYFFDELFRSKNVTREQANVYATVIQAGWRGYVVRTKLAEWLKKKKKFEEEKQRKRSLKIEELLAGLGITYQEATRAADVIKSAFRETQDQKMGAKSGELWVGESVAFGQRIREGDRALGRFDRWEKEDFGDFFEMDELGAIKYVWPRVGQLRRVLRKEIPSNVTIVEFFGGRDLEGREQYSYLIKTPPGDETRGVPIGFLTPMPKAYVQDSPAEVEFVSAGNNARMGSYTYLFRDDCTREELEKFVEVLKAQEKVSPDAEVTGEQFDYDPCWVLPRILIRTKKELIEETDDEVKFVSLPSGVVCEQENYTFRAETPALTAKIIRHILKDKCLTVEEGLVEAGNMSPYKIQETGRIFPVDEFDCPKYIQKIEIQPESATGEEEERNIMNDAYIFLPLDSVQKKKAGKSEPLFKIPIIRFQGIRSGFMGSADLEGKVFIMGPKITTPDGKPFTYESIFWDEFGEVAWHQLLHTISMQEEAGEEEEMEMKEEETEEPVEVGGEGIGEKDEDRMTETESHKQEKFTDRSDQTELVKTLPEESDVPMESPTAPPTEQSEAEGETKVDINEEEKEPLQEQEPAEEEKEPVEVKEEPEPETEEQ